MQAETVAILDGGTFVVSDRRGDFDASQVATHGLFHSDTRYLSCFRLSVNGVTPKVLSIDDSVHYAAQFFLVHPTESVIEDAQLSVIRKRTIDFGFREEITILSHDQQEVEVDVRIEVAADFADLFEVKEQLTKVGERFERLTEDGLVLGYRRASFCREILITVEEEADDLPGSVRPEWSTDGVRFQVCLPPRGTWMVTIAASVLTDVLGETVSRRQPPTSFQKESARDAALLDDWRGRLPSVTSDWAPLEAAYQQSVADLAALRLPTNVGLGAVVPAAGLPWFMCLFGRDSIITSYQALPFAPDLAEATLRVLAVTQARTVDDFRDAEPGKIMHESRAGELTAFEERPHSPYYGTVDATPLFLVLLDEYERWTGDEALVVELERPARAALEWIDDYGDRGDGYVSYERRNTTSGLENQCWKDSHNSMLFGDGTKSATPLSTCEVQGYVYDAKRRVARLARTFWGDPALAARLEAEADALKERFNRDFWLDDREFFALAIDGDGRRVDSLTSNIGHLLWSGIADLDKAHACRSHLLGPRLFSGWGVRTMAQGDGGYNPVGYHNGSVWPHDNSLIAHGLASYGYRDEAALIAAGVLEAGAHLRNRLPEAIAGYSRAVTRFPVEFPTACSPQAWAAGATLLFIRTLMGLELDDRRLRVDPILPAQVGHIDVVGIRGRWGRATARSKDLMTVAGSGAGSESLRHILAVLPGLADPAEVIQLHGSVRLDTTEGNSWRLQVVGNRLVIDESVADADCIIAGSENSMIGVYQGDVTPTIAAMQGRLTIEGDATLALQYGNLIASAGRNSRS